MLREHFPADDRAAWRRRDLTASRFAALFDAHPYVTRAQLAAHLRGAKVFRAFNQDILRAGKLLEPSAALAVSWARPEWKLTKATDCFRLPEHRISAIPDYLVGDDGLVEITTVSPKEWRGVPPVHKVIQTRVEMLVTGRERGWLAVMLRALPELPLYLFDVTLEPAEARRLLDAAAAWWEAHDRGEIAAAFAPPPTPPIQIVQPPPRRRIGAIRHVARR